MSRRKGPETGADKESVPEKAKESVPEKAKDSVKTADPVEEPALDSASAVPESPASAAETQPISTSAVDPKELPAIEPPEPKAEPWPDATPTPMKPVAPGDAVARQRTETVAMPVAVDIGRPPDMPRTSAPPLLVLGSVEDPTHMPGPREIPSGNPEDQAPPPGRVPPGDSRSLRRDNEFALVYRVGTCVITRTGFIGTRGQWRVVEYPTSSSASNSYAKECSRFVSEGFSDYRE